MDKVSHPKQYSKLVEEKLSSVMQWYFSEYSEVMISDKRSVHYDFFYNLFFPILLESNLKNNIQFESFTAYLINHSKVKEEINIPIKNSPKIIYFVNNSNSQIEIENKKINLKNMSGNSIFINNLRQINLSRSSNIQTCILLLNLIKDADDKKNYIYN